MKEVQSVFCGNYIVIQLSINVRFDFKNKGYPDRRLHKNVCTLVI